MAEIFFCDMKKFGHLYEECIDLLPPKRKAKAERLINKNDAILSATAGLMMKRVLGIENDEALRFNEHGKPFLEHGPFFSISHSRQFSVLAVSENEIGIDIEMHQSQNRRLMERCFTKEEQRFADLSTENFIKIWEAKEAVLKLLGTGFSFAPRNFSVLPLDEEHTVNGKTFRFYCTDLGGTPLVAAFCGNDDFKITEFEPEDLIY